MTLGDFALDDLDLYGWILFIFATIVNLIVMLNLLIAIISSTYERVIGDQIEYAYKERVSLIADIQLLTYNFGRLFKHKHSETKLLFFAWE